MMQTVEFSPSRLPSDNTYTPKKSSLTNLPPNTQWPFMSFLNTFPVDNRQAMSVPTSNQNDLFSTPLPPPPPFNLDNDNYLRTPSEVIKPVSPPPSPQLLANQKPSRVTVVPKHLPIHASKTAKSPLAVFRQFLLVSDGRDKTLKMIQYFVKILLWAHLSRRKKYYPLLYQRLSALASNFSTTRKIIRLGHVVEPYSTLLTYYNGEVALRKDAILREKLIYYTGFISAIASLANDLVDDAYCLGRIGAFDPVVAKVTEPISIKLWFSCIWIDIYENMLQSWGLWEEMEDWKRHLQKGQGNSEMSGEWNDTEIEKWEKMKEKMFWLNFSLIKLAMDAGFCSCDIYRWRSSEGIQAWTGFFSAVMSGYKLWYKCSR